MTQTDLINRFCEYNLTKCEQFLMDYYAKDLKVKFNEAFQTGFLENDFPFYFIEDFFDKKNEKAFENFTKEEKDLLKNFYEKIDANELKFYEKTQTFSNLEIANLELKLHNKIKLNYEKEMQTLHSKYQDFLEAERQCFQQMTKIKRR